MCNGMFLMIVRVVDIIIWWLYVLSAQLFILRTVWLNEIIPTVFECDIFQLSEIICQVGCSHDYFNN